MQFPSLAELWQGLRQQVFPRWVLVALESEGVLIQEWKPGRQSTTPVWELSWPKGLCASGRPTHVEALGAFLGDFLIEQGIVAAHALVALPPECAQWRVVEGLSVDPAVWPNQLQRAEGLLRLPLRLEQWQLNVRALPSAASGPLLVAADRGAVDGWIEVFAQAGLTLDRLEPVQTCWMEALLPQLRQQNAQDLLVLLHQECNGRVWIVVWGGLEPVYAECFQGDLEAGMPVLERRLQALLAQRQAQRCSLFWDGPSDALLLEKPASLPSIQPVELAEFGCLALAGLARSELP
jgi:hypothetical protein